MTRESAYLPVFYRAPLPEGDTWQLDGPDGHHAAKVRRVRVGERLRIADENGQYADCVATGIAGATVTVEVQSRGMDAVRTPRLVVVQALPKADRGTLAVELLTEIGVDEIVPWQAAHSVAKWDGKETKARQRWAQIAREAAKQSRRTRVPVIADPVRGEDIAARIEGAQAIVLHESATDPISQIELDRAGSDVVLVVGPEGGIAPDELELMRDAGARIAALGPEVLRTSTAGLSAATWASLALGRWEPLTVPS